MTSPMQRRHFEMIARVIKEADFCEESSRTHIAYRFARELRMTNPMFNRDKFLEACGVKV